MHPTKKKKKTTLAHNTTKKKKKLNMQKLKMGTQINASLTNQRLLSVTLLI